MKTAAIILMYIGLFALVNDSQAADSDFVWDTLWKEGGRQNEPHKAFTFFYIRKDNLATYLKAKNWNDARVGFSADDAVDKILARDNLISKGMWDAMIKTEAFIHAKNLGDVWSLLPKVGETVSRDVLAQFLSDEKWNSDTRRMTEYTAAGYFTGTGSVISRDLWTAMIEIAKCIREAP